MDSQRPKADERVRGMMRLAREYPWRGALALGVAALVGLCVLAVFAPPLRLPDKEVAPDPAWGSLCDFDRFAAGATNGMSKADVLALIGGRPYSGPDDENVVTCTWTGRFGRKDSDGSKTSRAVSVVVKFMFDASDRLAGQSSVVDGAGMSWGLW